MATAQRTWPRVVVGALRRTAWQLKSALCLRSAQPRVLQFFTFFLQLLLVNYIFRTQGSRPRGQGHKKNPRPRPRTAFPRTDTLEAKGRNARGQGPRTQAQVLSKKKKKGLHKNFSSELHEKTTFSKKFFKRSTKF